MKKDIEENLKKLSKDVYHVTQEKGTEAPFSGKYYKNTETGMYVCTVCGEPLFNSENKYDSGSGWPSFDRPVDESNVAKHTDTSLGIERTEVVCKHCGAHLGHVFDDGPTETTGKRYCINSLSLDFKKKDKSSKTES